MKLRTRARTPEAPGPGPIPPAALRGMDIALRKRIQGNTIGERRTPILGDGTELAQVRPYVPGDDVRKLDPNAFARTGEPHVRVHVGERAATAWVVLDWGPNMLFGTQDRRKCDVAEGVALAVGQIGTRMGGRLGVVVCGTPTPLVRSKTHTGFLLRPRQGRGGLIGLVHALASEPPVEGVHGWSLGEGIERLRRLAQTRGAVVVISDFRGSGDWVAPLKAIGRRHGVLCVEVRDPREDELVDIGDVWMQDPRTGRAMRIDTGSRKLRERFAAAAADERAAVARAIRRTGASHVVVSTKGDWLRELARFLDQQERAGR